MGVLGGGALYILSISGIPAHLKPLFLGLFYGEIMSPLYGPKHQEMT